MTMQLPPPISRYFEADRGEPVEAVLACFADEAVVKDEGRVHRGHDAIRAWKIGATKKYNYTVEPFAIETDKGRQVVTSHLVGDFPGSPVDLRYFFVLDGDKISELEITL